MPPEPRRETVQSRRAMTLVEIIIVTLLAGLIIPSLMNSLTNQVRDQGRNIRREMAVILAEEGTELILNAGFRHWMPEATPALFPGHPVRRGVIGANPVYSYSSAVPNVQGTAVTVTITALGTANVAGAPPFLDDPFNPFVGNIHNPGNPRISFRPWSDFSRRYLITNQGTIGLGASPNVLECFVEVFYGETSPLLPPTDFVRIPVYVARHPTANLRGLLWWRAPPVTPTLISGVAGLTFSPTLNAWGFSGQSTNRPLLDSVFPGAAGGGFPP